jgi:phospholipid/cholesterol/gamma-HCH transport system ATP-binding protein
VVGLEDKADLPPSELSGGMIKRVAIARALVMDPQLVLFDEPTSELDPLSSVNISGEILKLKEREGVTVVVVTHDRDLAFGVADRMAFIHEGNILFVGTPAEVRACDNRLIHDFLAAAISRK